MAQLIGVVGYECEDITVYLAGILHSLGKKAAIVDRTEQEMLLEMLGIRAKEESIKEGEYCGIWITNQQIRGDEYDIVYYVFGYRLEHPKILECEALLMITDGVPVHAALLNRTNQWECRRYLLIRNLISMKHAIGYLTMLADVKSEYSEIPYDERDIRQRSGLSAYSGIEFKRLSGGMKNALLRATMFLIDGYSEKTVWGVMKKR